MVFWKRALAATAVAGMLAGLPLAAAVPAQAPAQQRDGTAEAAVNEFFVALNSLDTARFGALFADDATLFFPTPPFPIRRIEGKAEIMRYFGMFFDSLRRRGARSINTAPRDLRIQRFGDFAIASFHLVGGQDVGRRTLVMRRSGGRWQIVYLHGSTLREPAPAPQAPAPTPPPPAR